MFLFYLSKVLIHFPCVVFNLLRTFLEFVLHRTNIICHTPQFEEQNNLQNAKY